ncbi:MAG: hypothetical protein AAF446_02305 [Pseudomonadota bacterium]
MMLKAKYAIVCISLSLLLTACRSGGHEPIALSEHNQAAAEQTLYPRFELAHAAPRELNPDLQQKLDEILQRLGSEAEQSTDQNDFKLTVTAEPDADAGCIAGGRLFVSEGMLAWIQNADELAGVIAMAMQQCPRASRLWREREDMRLIEFDEPTELMYRYIDYRLNANASLFNQLVASGCGSSNCFEAVSTRLATAGFDTQAAAGLYSRIRQGWPQSVWLERIASESDAVSNVPADAEWTLLLEKYEEKRQGYADLAEVRRQISHGRLDLAYRAIRDARRVLGHTYETEMMQAELDLHNNHGYYSVRILERLESKYGELPHHNFYWGWAHAQARRRQPGLQQLYASIETLPKVTAYYYLGRTYFELGDEARAIEYFTHVLEAGPINPYADNAEQLIARARS